MSKVDVTQITYPYINIKVSDDKLAEKIGVNLSKLYLYIGEHKNMGRVSTYGNAYKAIRLRANRLLGRNDVKISKREVVSLRKYKTILGGTKYIKIPYKLFYIFKAIFQIVDELKIEYPLSDELENFVGKVRRDIFYQVQSELYSEWYKANKDDLTRGLHDDIFAGNTILSKEF